MPVLPHRLAALLATSGLVLAACTSDPSSGGGDPRPPTVTPSAPSATTAPGSSSPAFGSTVVTGLNVPWGLAHLPDGSALVTERDTATVLHLRPGRQPRTVTTLKDVRPDQEGGLLGVAVSPEFATDRRVFVYYTAADDNRVERLRWTGSRLVRDKTILTGIPKASFHNGGRLAFGPDRRLYVTTGDAGETSRAQDRASLGGKILRVTQDGAAAPGNPFDTRVWSYGHRNVQGIAWDSSGRMFATEFGQNTWDELNRIEAGKNYGWPTVEGKGGQRGLVDPLVIWRTSESSPSGLAIARGTAYVAALAGQRVWRVPLSDGRAGTPTRAAAPDLGRVRTVQVGPDGRLWVMSSNTFRGEVRDGDDRIITWRPT
jgi:glucose/arabinose dehydrogenase